MICWKCKKDIKLSEVFRSSECPECGCDLRCCKQCVFYSVGSHYDCKESIDSFVADKKKANFCDFFRLNTNLIVKTDRNDARSAAAVLFGDANICNDDKKSGIDEFNSLFG